MEAMEGSASPRKPRVAMESRSSRGAEFGGGVALEGEQGVVADHAAAVVGDADELAAAGFDLDADAGRAGVERVLQQLLDDRGRPVDDLAGGDLVGDLVGENADAAHVCVKDMRSTGVEKWFSSGRGRRVARRLRRLR